MRRARRPLLVAVAAIGASACGGGSGGGSASPGGATPDSASTKPTGRGTVVVTVTDVLGEPVAGADVRIYTYWTDEDKRISADAKGRVEVRDVIASKVTLAAYGSDSYSGPIGKTVTAGAALSVGITAQPTAEGAGGITRAWVPAGGVSTDGRALEFSLQIVQVPPDADVTHWAWDPGAVRILPCTPDPTNDLPQFRADCVSGTNGFDAAYTGVAEGPAVPTTNLDAPGPYAAALLIDESSHIVVDDPADARLFAAKYFLTFASSSHPMSLAAFASDDPTTGRLGLLPQKPVSVFMLENPQYVSNGRSYFPTVDDLGVMEGGAAPLFAAVNRMLDFAAASQNHGTNAVVVVTDGRDDTCGPRVECQVARDALIQKSRSMGVAIVTIGLANAAGTADHETLALLAQGAPQGAAFWAQDPKQLATILGTVNSYLGDSKAGLQAKFRVESSVAGAFSSGRKVLGTVRLETCPFDCVYTFIPFVVQIP
jgi:hypothetical protein